MNGNRLHQLIDDWREGTLSDAAAAELSQLLRESSEAREVFRAESQLHGLLHRAVMAEAVEAAANAGRVVGRVSRPDQRFEQGDGPGDPSYARYARFPRWRVGLVLGALALCVTAVFVWIHSEPQQAQPPESLATLTHVTNCVWEGPFDLREGDRLTAGPLELREGTAEITLTSGVVMLVESPVRFELIDVGNSLLREGRMVARVPPAAVGFAVETPRGRFVDLGTEFGVSVEPGKETIVQVFDGAVEVELKAAGGVRSNRRLVAGEAIRIADADRTELQEVVFSHERFLRTFHSPHVDEGDELIPFQASRVSSLDVLPVAGSRPVTIDGSLDEWEPARMFEARCAEPFADSHFVQGGLMYDEQHLYVAARVGDPLPLRSLSDPEHPGSFAWAGGSLQLRLSTDRALGWPVDAVVPSKRLGAVQPQDTSERIAHLTLWYFQPREQPCLQIEYGMDLERTTTNPAGWSGVFRKAADGQSYTVEYAIPWHLLGAGADPPRAGDVLGLCWIVNWSDATGKRWKGQLIENKNPRFADRGEKALTFWYAETWGKAIYQ